MKKLTTVLQKYPPFVRFLITTTIVIVLTLGLLWLTSELGFAMNDEELKKIVKTKVGKDSIGQAVIGGAGLVSSALMGVAGNLKMAGITLLGVPIAMGIYNSGFLF